MEVNDSSMISAQKSPENPLSCLFQKIFSVDPSAGPSASIYRAWPQSFAERDRAGFRLLAEVALRHFTESTPDTSGLYADPEPPFRILSKTPSRILSETPLSTYRGVSSNCPTSVVLSI